MSLDEKKRCALDTNEKHLSMLEHLDTAVIGIDIHFISQVSIIYFVIFLYKKNTLFLVFVD